MQITFDTTNPKDLQILEQLFANLNLPATSADAQPEVASNTGSTATGLTLSPEGSGVDESAAPAVAPVTEKPKRTRKAKEETAPVEENVSKETEKVDTSAEPVAASDKPLTLDEVRAALQSFTATKGVPAGIELLKDFGATRISELAAEKYNDFVVKCEVAA